jgi:hypothetical protein
MPARAAAFIIGTSVRSTRERGCRNLTVTPPNKAIALPLRLLDEFHNIATCMTAARRNVYPHAERKRTHLTAGPGALTPASNGRAEAAAVRG